MCAFLAYDIYPDKELEKKYNVEYVSLETLLKESDAVTIHCPLMPSTRGLINRESLAMMKSSAVLVNTSRGGMIVTEDLVEALKNRVIRYAALDVFDDEGTSEAMGKAFRDLDNVIITPHSASSTFKTLADMLDGCIDAIEAFINDKPPASLLNPNYILHKRT